MLRRMPCFVAVAFAASALIFNSASPAAASPVVSVGTAHTAPGLSVPGACTFSPGAAGTFTFTGAICATAGPSSPESAATSGAGNFDADVLVAVGLIGLCLWTGLLQRSSVRLAQRARRIVRERITFSGSVGAVQ